MKSLLGLIAGGGAAAAYAFAYWLSVRPGAGWLDGQWLFLAALPYNWASLHVAGVSDFSPDAPGQVVAGGLCDVALAYLAGAIVQALARGGLWLARLRRRA